MKRMVWATALVAALCLAFAAPVAAKNPVRPFAGWTNGTDSFDLAAPGCEAGAVIRYHDAGSGQFLHLGRVHVEVTHCTYMDSGTAGHFGPGTITITAANGDTLVLRQAGSFVFDQPMPSALTSSIRLSWTVVGGTGRFDDARGPERAPGTRTCRRARRRSCSGARSRTESWRSGPAPSARRGPLRVRRRRSRRSHSDHGRGPWRALPSTQQAPEPVRPAGVAREDPGSRREDAARRRRAARSAVGRRPDAGRGTCRRRALPRRRRRPRRHQGPGPRRRPGQGGRRQAGRLAAGGGGRRGPHPGDGHQGDHRPQGPGRAGRGHRQGVLPGGDPGPGQPADRRDGVRGGRRRDRGGRQGDAGGDPPGRGPSAPGAARLPGPRAGVRRWAGRAAPARFREDRPGSRRDHEGQRRGPRGGQPAGDHPRERHRGPRRAPRLPRREDHPRRLCAAPPPRPGEAARPRRGGPCGLGGAPLRHQLHPPRRVDRLHGQRRRPRHDHDGPREAGRRRAGQLPRHRRRRQGRPRGGGHAPDPGRPEGGGDPGQHLRRHHPRRRGGARPDRRAEPPGARGADGRADRRDERRGGRPPPRGGPLRDRRLPRRGGGQGSGGCGRRGGCPGHAVAAARAAGGAA